MGAEARVSLYMYGFHLLRFIHAGGSSLRLYDGSDLGFWPDVLLQSGPTGFNC